MTSTDNRKDNAITWCAPLLGIIGVRVWLGCLPYGQQVLGNGDTGLIISLFLRGTAPLLIAALLRGRPLERTTSRILNIGCTIALIASGLMAFLAPSGLFGTAMLALGSAVAGWLYIQWGAYYARFPLPAALAHICISLSAAALIVGALSFLPNQFTGALLFICPLLGCIAFERMSAVETPVLQPSPRMPKFGRDDAKWFVSMMLYSLVWGIMQAMPFGSAVASTSIYHIVYRVGGAIIAALPLLWMLLLKSDFRLDSIWLGISGAATASFLLILVSDGMLDNVALTLFATVNYLILAYWWIRIVDFSQRSDRPAYVLFAFGWMSMLVCTGLGELLAKWLGKLDNSLVVLVALGIFLIVSFLAVLLRPNQTEPHTAKESPRVIVDSAEPRITMNEILSNEIEQVAKDFHLTEREKEIAILLRQGRTWQSCADELSISLNTVRGHMKRLYAKMDVHSKEEMLSIFGQYRNGK